MLTQSQQDRLDRKCVTVLAQAIDAFPTLLADSEPDKAAALVADLIKTQITRPVAEADPAAELARIIQVAAAMDPGA